MCKGVCIRTRRNLWACSGRVGEGVLLQNPRFYPLKIHNGFPSHYSFQLGPISSYNLTYTKARPGGPQGGFVHITHYVYVVYFE